MFGKHRYSILSAISICLVLCLQHSDAGAFELFPRPVGQHTVQRNQNLFGLAGQYYADPSLWPFLWNQNPSLRLKGTGPLQDQPLQENSRVQLYDVSRSYPVVNQSYSAPTGLPEETRFLISKTPYQGIPYDRKFFRFRLSLRPIQIWGYIASAPESYKTHFLERDLVYIKFRPSKRQAILVGDRFGIYRDRGPLTHPLNPDKPLGILSEIVGEVEVTSTGHNLITAIILDSYVEIVKGDKITLFTPREREIVPTKTHRLLTGTILNSATRDTFYQDNNNIENDILFIDRGECDGMKEGLLLNIYRPSNPVFDPFFMQRELNTPDRYVGEAMVLKAFENNSTILITRSREEVIPGDIIKSVSD